MEIKEQLEDIQRTYFAKMISKRELKESEKEELALVSRILNNYYPKINIKLSLSGEFIVSSNKPVSVDISGVEKNNFVAGVNVTIKQ